MPSARSAGPAATRRSAARSQHPASTVERIAKIHELSNLLIERELAGQGISGILPAHGGVLSMLFRQNGPVPIKDLVAYTGRAKSTVTGVVQTLERHGYLDRSPDPADQRSSLIQLTPAGRQLKTAVAEVSRQLVSTVLAGLSDQEQETLIALLVRVEDNLTEELA